MRATHRGAEEVCISLVEVVSVGALDDDLTLLVDEEQGGYHLGAPALSLR
jgi:hypothetical protein